MSKSAIEWTTYTWNPVIGCNKVSQGCQNCYALTMSARIANTSEARRKKGETPTDLQEAYEHVVKYNEEKGQYEPKWTGNIITLPEKLDEPYTYQNGSRVFVDSMTDIFHPDVPVTFLNRIFKVMAKCPTLQFQILTKRPENMAKYINADDQSRDEVWQMIDQEAYSKQDKEMAQRIRKRGWPPKNVWFGTSVESEEVGERINDLAMIECERLFLSIEPMIGPVNLRDKAPVQWVIVGGESGYDARPLHPDWVRDIRHVCDVRDIPFFFKQWGAWGPMKGSGAKDPTPVGYWKQSSAVQPDDHVIHRYGDYYFVRGITSRSDAEHLVMQGKKKTGNVLGGKIHKEFPKQMVPEYHEEYRQEE